MALQPLGISSTGNTEVKATLVESEDAPGGYALVNPLKVNKPATPTDLVDLARQVQAGNDMVRHNASSKLSTIAEQIRFLQEQAQKVLVEAKRDSDLHKAACNMVKKPGSMYYHYKRPTGQTYLSLISPSEWGSSCPHEFLGAFRLEYDLSWTPVEKIPRKDEELCILNKVLSTQEGLVPAALRLTSAPLTNE